MSPITPGYAIAHLDPGFFESLSEAELVAALFEPSLWVRPDQQIPRYAWRSFGFIAGRGFGKSFTIASEINRRVELGLCKAPALMAPNDDRVEEVQVDFLVDTSPPWFRAEKWEGTVRWPNGVEAVAYTPLAPGRPRSGNHDLSWLCEIVDWNPATRLEAYRNISVATRVGGAQIIWDTTSKGKNEVTKLLREENARDPVANVIRRGITFDNPLLSEQYLRALVRLYLPVGSRRYCEEVLGMAFDEAAGSLWEQSWIDDHRDDVPPQNIELRIVSLDPSLSDHQDADEYGICVASRTTDKHIHVEQDLTELMKPERGAAIAVEQCLTGGAAGIILERNHSGDNPVTLIRLLARDRGVHVELLVDEDRPFPPRTPGRIYVREVVATKSKETRASGPAALAKKGRLHHVGTLPALEDQMVTWVPGQSKSPNRLDACAQAVSELAGLISEERDNRQAISEAAAIHRRLLNLGSHVPHTRQRGRLGI